MISFSCQWRSETVDVPLMQEKRYQSPFPGPYRHTEIFCLLILKLMKTGDVLEKAFVIELKTVKQEGRKPVTMEMLDKTAEEAIKQIDDGHYADSLLEEGYGNIGRYGISFFKKHCRVHYRDGY